MVQSDPAWQELIDQVRARRASKLYMPASLLVALDMVEAGEAAGGLIPFNLFEKRFRALLSSVKPQSAGKAWQPFFHLSGPKRAWMLERGGVESAPPTGWRPTSRVGLSNEADGARIREELRSVLDSSEVREAVRTAIYELLELDADTEAARLASTHRKA